MKNLRTAWKIAVQTSLPELEDACLNCMRANFSDFINAPLLIGLKLNPFLDLLKRPQTVMKSEELKFTSIASWVEADHSQTRYTHVTCVLNAISQAQLSLDFIVQKLSSKSTFNCHPDTM